MLEAQNKQERPLPSLHDRCVNRRIGQEAIDDGSKGSVGCRIELVGEPAHYHPPVAAARTTPSGKLGWHCAPISRVVGWGLSPNETIGPEFHQWSAAARPKCFVEGVES
jgi:hypothetical protein